MRRRALEGVEYADIAHAWNIDKQTGEDNRAPGERALEWEIKTHKAEER